MNTEIIEKKKILVVEDDEKLLRIIRFHLNQMGFNDIIDAENGDDALKTLHANRFDLIITDWHMPGMDGLDFFNALKNDESLNSIPVLMITGEAQREKMVQALNNGIKHYLVKPFDGKDLKKEIEVLLDIKMQN